MKIYTLVKLERIEDSENISLEHFETKEEALAALREAAENDIKTCEENSDWEHDEFEEGDESYSSWEDGYECHNHVSLSIIEKEINFRHKVRNIFGKDLSSRLDDIYTEFEEKIDNNSLTEDDKKKLTNQVRQAQIDYCGVLVQRTFATENELRAYDRGMGDQDGWEHVDDGDDYSWIPEEIWDESEARNCM